MGVSGFGLLQWVMEGGLTGNEGPGGCAAGGFGGEWELPGGFVVSVGRQVVVRRRGPWGLG